MRVAYITAGAGGMICGSCLHDNTLAGAMILLTVSGLIGAVMSVNRITRVDPIIALGRVQ